MTQIETAAELVMIGLRRTRHQLVLAESCTSGLVAASLGAIPGASRHFCGSAVVYQEATKASWLGIPIDFINRFGVVSAEVADAMAVAALKTTPHATLAAAITGHLGPNSPVELDGIVFVAVAAAGKATAVHQRPLEDAGLEAGLATTNAAPVTTDTDVDLTGQKRRRRQQSAAIAVLQILADTLHEVG